MRALEDLLERVQRAGADITEDHSESTQAERQLGFGSVWACRCDFTTNCLARRHRREDNSDADTMSDHRT